jgi:hypothetical protein
MRKWGLPCRGSDRSDRSNIESCWNCFMWPMSNGSEDAGLVHTFGVIWRYQKIVRNSTWDPQQTLSQLFGIDPGHSHSLGFCWLRSFVAMLHPAMKWASLGLLS